MSEYFVNIQNAKVFVKDGDFFRTQVHAAQPEDVWWHDWIQVFAEDFEAARSVGETIKLTGLTDHEIASHIITLSKPCTCIDQCAVALGMDLSKSFTCRSGRVTATAAKPTIFNPTIEIDGEPETIIKPGRIEFIEPESLDAHYASMKLQPTYAAMVNDLDACQHHLTKYVWRWRLKHNGTRDLRAARKLLGQYIHFEETGEWVNHQDLPTELK